MSKLCPCGCGKKLSLIERGGATQVQQLGSRIEFLEALAVPLQEAKTLNSRQLEEFIDAGRAFQRELLAVMHGELDARHVDRKAMNQWSRTAAKIRANSTRMLRAVDE